MDIRVLALGLILPGRAGVSRIIRITPIFLAELASGEIKYPGCKATVLTFLDNRRNNTVWQGYGAKDARMKGNLNDTWHVHIVHGTLVLFYGILAASLDAYCLRAHDNVETTPKLKALRKTIDAFKAGDFVEFDAEAALRSQSPQFPPIEPDDLSDLRTNIYDLLARDGDRDAVEAAANGNWELLSTFVVMMAEFDVEPPGFWDAVVSAFGGATDFKNWLAAAIKQIPRTSI